MNQIEVAKMVATRAHRGQTDMAGEPYIEHCQRVVRNLREAGYDSIEVQAVAWLHDVVEDTAWSLNDLRVLGFSTQIVDGVDAMSQRTVDGVREDLENYWERVKANDIARVVKLYGDIPDNDDPNRKAYLSESLQNKLTSKYERARRFLSWEQ